MCVHNTGIRFIEIRRSASLLLINGTYIRSASESRWEISIFIHERCSYLNRKTQWDTQVSMTRWLHCMRRMMPPSLLGAWHTHAEFVLCVCGWMCVFMYSVCSYSKSLGLVQSRSVFVLPVLACIIASSFSSLRFLSQKEPGMHASNHDISSHETHNKKQTGMSPILVIKTRF